MSATGNQQRVAVVTGGSKGIGRSIALALAGQGYAVAILDPLAEGERVAGRIVQDGGRALYLATDVADEQAVLQAVARVRDELGAATLLVNNAGIFPRAAALEMPFTEWMHTVQVNLGGAFLCSRSFAPDMLARGGGVIVNIASGRALAGAVHGSHYASSKAGIVALTRSLALEWAPTIRVNAVIPGITDTDQPRQEGITDEELYRRGAQAPLGRIGQPEDVAGVVCFLASAAAGFITGQSLCVNGGAIMQ